MLGRPTMKAAEQSSSFEGQKMAGICQNLTLDTLNCLEMT